MRFVAVLAVLMSSSIAAAQAPGQTMSWDPSVPPTVIPTLVPAGPPTQVSYRKDILLADGISLGLMLLGPALAGDEMGDGGAQLAGIGLSGYFLAAPIVHLAHGRGGSAVKSFAMRSTFPLLGAYLGYQIGPSDTACVQYESDPEYSHGHSHGCGGGSIAGLVLGGLAGAGAAMYIDAAYLAKYEKPAPLMWSASVRRTHGGYSVGISRQF